LILRQGPPPARAPGQFEGRARYRPDIDGLRAIAILPVVLFHAGIPGFTGGFVGVDVFFVISGYLMASLIAGEIDEGNFSLLRFYERRIRRIFPALFAMMAVCSVVAWIVMMPVELAYFGRSMIAAALFTSNIQFAKEVGYFDIGAQMKPLLHTWSLAVEEQFYIVFPPAMMVIHRVAPRGTVPILLAVLTASLAASVSGMQRDPTAVFYLAQYRAWELLIGALLALNIVPRPGHRLARQVLAATGIVLIATAIFAYSEATAFPGLAALVPCLGAACVIHASAGKGAVGRLLSVRPLVFVGLISYSLYLWHWPMIVFTRYLFGRELSPVQGGLVVLASLILAALSWRFIERPFRGRHGFLATGPLFATALSVMAVTLGFGGYVAASGGAPGRLSPGIRAIYAATYDRGRFYQEGCFTESDRKGASVADIRSGNLCRLGAAGGGDPDFLVWGDSHAASMAPAIDAAATQKGAQGMFAGHASCPPLAEVKLLGYNDTRRCDAFNAAVRDLIAARHIPLVFMVAYWPKYVHGAELPNQGEYFDPAVPPPLGANRRCPRPDSR
jgi:peptidoglycan/LPS O-acetylase OafA/YrhL